MSPPHPLDLSARLFPAILQNFNCTPSWLTTDLLTGAQTLPASFARRNDQPSTNRTRRPRHEEERDGTEDRWVPREEEVEGDRGAEAQGPAAAAEVKRRMFFRYTSGRGSWRKRIAWC